MRRLLFLVLMFSSAGAFAQEPQHCWYPQNHTDQCFPDASSAAQYWVDNQSTGDAYVSAALGQVQVHNATSGRFCRLLTRTNGTIQNNCWLSLYRSGTCPTGTEYNSVTGACDQDCSLTEGQGGSSFFQAATRTSPDTPFDPGSGGVSVPSYMCGSGCRYRDSTVSSTITCGPLTGSDMLTLYCIGMFTGTGEQCQSGDHPQQTSGDIGGPPAQPPTDPDDPTDPANNCGPSHVWSGSVCTPVFAPDPANPGDGGGNDDGGDNGGGNNGGGNGDGGGDGDGDGNGDGNGNGDGGGSTGGGGGCGAGSCPNDGPGDGSDGQPHDWYIPGELTIGGVLDDFHDRMANAPIVQSTSAFFTVNVSGSCPIWHAQAWVFSITFDQHCSTNMPWDLIRAVLLACASFVAFRWAFL